MTMPMFDDFHHDTLRPSLRIAPLQVPFLSSSSIRPSPLEPNARINIDDDANQLTGRRKALAQAKFLDTPEADDWDAISGSKIKSDFPTVEVDPFQERPREKQRLRSYDHGQITDFVQLPKPPEKSKQDKPRPFQPVSVLNELHEPPPSAALFPPITPSANQEAAGLMSRDRPSKREEDKDQGPATRKKSSDRSSSPSIITRTYNRGRTKWSQEEIDHLIRGVTICGTGRWKTILEHPDLHFREGRTPTDLKDRFRVCFPQGTKGRLAKPLPKKAKVEDVVANASVQSAIIELLPKKERPAQRARKRHWTEAEDAELEKGFRKHGYNWNAMVKDISLRFDGRSGGQIRDRFRLKFKELYEGQDVTLVPNKSGPKPEQKLTLTASSSDGTAQVAEDMIDTRNQGKAPSSTAFPCNLLNGEDEDNRLPNSVLHTYLDWDENLTLAPLTWEDMATRPIFTFD